MKDLLVGSTGFVGQNLMAAHSFDAVCHSTDVGAYYGSKPELCVYCGVPAAMYLANVDPQADLAIMHQARENLKQISPQKVVLISTIAVYADSKGKDEDALMWEDGLQAYGKNRLWLERWVREDHPDALILRLPALYGRNLKKNFLFDLHTIVPTMLKEDKYEELKGQSELVGSSYELHGNGFYKLKTEHDKTALKEYFSASPFNALSFTDSRSKYQFYDLARLWSDIQIALKNGLSILNIAPEPLSAKCVYERITGKTDWDNVLAKEPFDYDMRTRYSHLFGRSDGYLIGKDEELDAIEQFMKNWRSEWS